MTPVSIEQSGAFVEVFSVKPTSNGVLDGLTFAVKDLIDIAGHTTGGGNPSWRDTHPPAACHAICVEQLLAAGAQCVGKTLTDELAFSLIGENHFYGTPLNPRAPDRVPGGSSSGSASAVACGLVDFALGTDTGGSVRVPASNCGLYGYRPSHGRISVAGVIPFAPTFDTVGVLARDASVLARVSAALLGIDLPATPRVGTIHLVREAFSLCDPEVSEALQRPLRLLKETLGASMNELSIHEIDQQPETVSLTDWCESIYRPLQCGEIWSSLGAWIDSARPEFGPVMAQNFNLARTQPRDVLSAVIQRREAYCDRLARLLASGDLLCLPTVPARAPLKGTIGRSSQAGTNYFPRALGFNAIAGVGRLPQITLPLAECEGSPIGLSLLAGAGHDGALLSTVLKGTSG